MKKKLNSELLLYPCPTILVTSAYQGIENVLAVSWAGIASSHPEHVTISLKKTRYSYGLIVSSGFFGLNVINDQQIKFLDYCGTISGRDKNKFVDCQFKKIYSEIAELPFIEDCPVNIGCKIVSVTNLGSHDLIVGAVQEKLVDSSIFDDNMHSKLKPAVYFRPNYYKLDSHMIGSFGFSIGEATNIFLKQSEGTDTKKA